jgi:serine/threonine protein kinase
MFYFFKARVLKFLYEKKISHMDLKPENILLTSVHKPILKVAGRSKALRFC